MERIYLDNAATTAARPDVVEAMLPHFTRNGYNASSLHAEGRAARAAVDDARERIARALSVRPKEIVFTAGGSEADNLAIAGAARAIRGRANHAVASTIEHHAVLHALDALAAEGWEITLVPVNGDGHVPLAAFEAALRPDTALASVMLANNEIGTIQDVRELAAAARRAGALFHTDAVQAPAHLPIRPVELAVDLLSLAAHKFYGPKGVGALYVRTGIPLDPIVRGGGQESGRRAGTENTAALVGMAAALDFAQAEQAGTAPRLRALRDRLEAGILERIPHVRINGREPRLPTLSSISFLGVESEHILMRLDLEGIAVSAGSACMSGVLEPSHVIAALGLPEAWMRGVVRFSLGRDTTAAHIDRVLEVLPRAIGELREFSPIPA